MKRKQLSDRDCICGSGWLPDDCNIYGPAFECPSCDASLDTGNKRTMKCPECNTKLRIERGVQYMARVTVETPWVSGRKK